MPNTTAVLLLSILGNVKISTLNFISQLANRFSCFIILKFAKVVEIREVITSLQLQKIIF